LFAIITGKLQEAVMSEDQLAQVKAIATQIARHEVMLHEIRFTLSGVVVGAVAALVWLAAAGKL
jgi:hypothetical protein